MVLEDDSHGGGGGGDGATAASMALFHAYGAAGAGEARPAPGLRPEGFRLPAVRALPAAYASEEASLLSALERGRARPTALAAADLDEDGVPDLVAGYAMADAGFVTLHRGNADAIWPNDPAAQARRAAGTHTDAPFLSPARAIGLSIVPDLLAAGDFDGDGHADLVAAARGEARLVLLTGDGRGGFGAPVERVLAGKVTALASGEINRRDGLPDLALGVEGASGAAVFVFESRHGALRGEPEALPLPAPASALALGDLNGDLFPDLVVAAGREAFLVPGRDRGRRIPSGAGDEGGEPALERILSLPAEIASIAPGDFSWDAARTREVALLTVAGSVHVWRRAAPEDPDGARGASADGAWREIAAGRTSLSGTTSDPRLPGRLLMTAARLSALPMEELVVLDRDGRRLYVTMGETSPDTGTGPVEAAEEGASAAVSSVDGLEAPVSTGIVSTGAGASHVASSEGGHAAPGGILEGSLEAALPGAPVAVIAMRLNGDGQSDLVLLAEGASEPLVMLSAPAATFVVNTAAAAFDASPGDGFCLTAAGECSLCAAIQEANATPAADSIQFAIPGAGPHTICCVGCPVITRPVFIDGTTQPGYAGTPLVALDGTGVGGGDGLTLTGAASSGSTLRGLAIHSYPTGIRIDLGSGGNFVDGCHIGTDASGTVDRGNTFDGIVLYDAGTGNRIGGTFPGARNVISGNGLHGVDFFGTASIGSDGNFVEGNHIGTDITGTIDLGNDGDGVVAWSMSSSNTIGGTAAGAGNLISGNGSNGIEIQSFSNLVQGNRIGTNAAGSSALRNDFPGVLLFLEVAISNTIGGTTAPARNLISGNRNAGVWIEDVGFSFFNRIEGNYIGTNAAGSAAVPNGNGVIITVSLSGISEDITLERNVLSGNTFDGLFSNTATDFGNNEFLDNLLGTDATGATDLGNGRTGAILSGPLNRANTLVGNVISGNDLLGIQIQNGAFAEMFGNRIGTSATGATLLGNAGEGVVVFDAFATLRVETWSGPNVIAGNGGIGLAVAGAGSIGQSESSLIFLNGSLGIDLGGDGVTPNDPNDPDTGPNDLQNYPVLTSAVVSPGAGTVTVSGTLNSLPSTQFRLEFFSNAACDTSGSGEGQHYLGFQNVTTDASGNAAFGPTVLSPASFSVANEITATAARASRTSEFSACLQASCTARAPFGRTLRPMGTGSLVWDGLADVRFVKGDLASVGSYATTGGGSLFLASSLDISADAPAAGSGLYYLVRHLGCGSWQNGAGTEPGRDTALP